MKVSGESPITARDGWFVGEDQLLQWTIYDLDPVTETNPPTAKDITGFTISFKMATAQGGTSILTKTATLPNPTAGVAQVAIASTDTPGLSGGTYFYDLARTDAGLNQVLAYGTAVLHPRVT